MPQRGPRRCWFVLLPAVVAACAAPKRPPREEPVGDTSGLLVPITERAARPFTVLQRITGSAGRQPVAFACEVRLAQGKLTVVGSTLFSRRAFVIEQQGVQLQAQAANLREVLFEPMHVLYDLHRVFFRGLGLTHGDGVYERIDEDEVVRERWREGRLVERSFHALETFSRLIVVDFEGAPSPVIAPRVRLTNLHYSYSLLIENAHQSAPGSEYTLDVEHSPENGVRKLPRGKSW
jgi:hypothetical protein